MAFDSAQILTLFRTLISQFSTKNDSEVLSFIDVAYQIVKTQDFKSQFDYNLGIVYVTADLIYSGQTQSQSSSGGGSSNSSTAGGQIVEKSIGDLTIRYSATSSTSSTGGQTVSTSISPTDYLAKYKKLLESNGSAILCCISD